MSRASINFLVDCVLLLILVALLWVSIVLRALFPAPSEAVGWSVFGMNYDTWVLIWFGIMLVLAVMVGLHLILHWTWICGFVSSRLSRALGRRVTTSESLRTIYGVVTLITILSVLFVLLFIAAMTTETPPPG